MVSISLYFLHPPTHSLSHTADLNSCYVTKMALNEVSNDLYIATSIGHFKTLIIFDISVAVGSVSHSLFFRKALSSWLHDTILSWFSSYPSGQFPFSSFVSFSSSIQLLNRDFSESCPNLPSSVHTTSLRHHICPHHSGYHLQAHDS